MPKESEGRLLLSFFDIVGAGIARPLFPAEVAFPKAACIGRLTGDQWSPLH
jgi:hypothetical protein